METIIAIKVSGGWMLITIGDWEGKMVVVTAAQMLAIAAMVEDGEPSVN